MRVYLGTFLIAFTSLALEVTLTRLLSASTWYHLAFFAISTAMLGMTAGSTLVHLRPYWFTPAQLHENLAKTCLGYAVSVPISLVVLCIVPLYMVRSVMSLVALVLVTTACAVPFVFSGMVLSVVLTQYPLPIGRLYFSDLLGASLGCLLVLGGLEVLDAPSLILLCGALGILAALSFGWREASWKPWRRRSVWAFGVWLALVVVNAATPYGITPIAIKGRLIDPATYELQKWNSFSWVTVSKPGKGPPQLWGASPLAPDDQELVQSQFLIDGEASTTLRRFSTPADIEHLRYDVTNLVYYLRPKGGVCVIGVGAGRDLQSAILFGQERIVGVDVNPVFIDLLQNRFRQFAGVADYPGVTLQVAEARTFLSQSPERFSVIQMSLIDTWAATGAGAFSFTENALYTEEGWQLFFERLKDDGIFTVSRWYSTSNLGETGRVASLAMATLYRLGIPDPAQHIAMVTSGQVSTLLLSRQPVSAADRALIQKATADLEYDIAIMPGVPPADPILNKIMLVKSEGELQQVIAHAALNYEPTTDEKPYFFNMLRLDRLGTALDLAQASEGVVQGNLSATLTLLALILVLMYMTAVTVLVPLLVKERSKGKVAPQVLWSGALYFSLIGAGFMLVEIALIQRLSIFLGHPAYALGILLFTIIASTSLGSLFSERLPLTRRPWVFLYPLVTAAAIVAVRFALTPLIAGWITQPVLHKALAAIALIFPLGILLGCFFPTGMRLVKAAHAVETPWYWALNGVFGVLCSALAVFISIYLGISINFYIAAGCYAALVFCLYRIVQHSQAA